MKIIFCEDPLNQKQVDAMYQEESTAAQKVGIPYYLISFENLISGSTALALRGVPQHDTVVDAIYRGWMLKPDQYDQLYTALLGRNIRLINTPEMYRHCHYLPESYSVIKDYTPKSIWFEFNGDFNTEALYNSLKVFGDKPIIIKDYVKSQKHYWNEACFIPKADDRQSVEAVTKRFVELQGTDLNVGLVFREFVDFQPLTQHSRSGMPLTREYRVFVLDGQPVFHTNYWSEGDYSEAPPTLGGFTAIMEAINSRFYTMDIAKRINGEWMIVELGDGQVAGLPDHVDVSAFYQAVQEEWERDV